MPARSVRPLPAHPSSEEWLNTLRGGAAAAVVFFHLNEGLVATPDWYRRATGQGWLGVPVFFVISGYLIVAAAQRQPDWRPFLVRRFWRIYPPYLASVALVIAVAVLRKFFTGINDVCALPAGWSGWIATLTLTTDPVTTVPKLNWVYWSLSCEAAFYLAIGLGLWLWPRRLAVWVGGITLACLVVGPTRWGSFFTGHWWQFALGATLALGVTRGGGMLLLGLCGLSALRTAPPSVLGVAAVTWASMLWARQPSGAWLNHERILRPIGAVSYSLYLVHVPLGVYLYARLRTPAIAAHWGWHLAQDLAVFGLCLASAWLFWRGCELPAHQMGRRIAAGFAPRRETDGV